MPGYPSPRPGSSDPSKPVSNMDKAMSKDHMQESYDYNMAHAKAHEKEAAAVASAIGDDDGRKGPEYGFYRAASPFSTVSDEGEVKNGVALGHREMDGQYFKVDNEKVEDAR